MIARARRLDSSELLTVLIDDAPGALGKGSTLKVSGEFINHARYGQQFRCRPEGSQGGVKNDLLELGKACGFDTATLHALTRLPFLVRAEAARDPYRLVQATSLSWSVIDRLGIAAGVSADSPNRIEGFWIYALLGRLPNPNIRDALRKTADTAIPASIAVQVGALALGLPTLSIINPLEGCPLDVEPVSDIWDAPAIMLRDIRQAEENVATTVRHILVDGPAAPCATFQSLDESLTKLQQQAIWVSANTGISCITGPPGSGKTTCIAELAYALESGADFGNPSVAVAAYTGKAAARVAVALNCRASRTKGKAVPTASTIHRLLECKPNPTAAEGFIFTRGSGFHLTYDTVIVEEASMVPVSLLESLMLALKPGARFVMVGDANQLPPLGAGQPFLDLLSSGILPCTTLTQIHRQAEGSAIPEACRLLLNRQAHAFFSFLRSPESATEIDWVPTEDAHIANTVLGILDSVAPDGAFLNEQMGVICPVKQGNAGTHALNVAIKQKINPNRERTLTMKTADGLQVSARDPVMWIKNDYTRSNFNGDCFWVTEIIDAVKAKTTTRNLYLNRTSKTDFDRSTENMVSTADAAKYLTLNYAMTVHKCQGSEFPGVIVVIPSYARWMVDLPMLYTAISRAKKRLWLVGSREVIRAAMEAPHPTPQTRFAKLLAAS